MIAQSITTLVGRESELTGIFHAIALTARLAVGDGKALSGFSYIVAGVILSQSRKLKESDVKKSIAAWMLLLIITLVTNGKYAMFTKILSAMCLFRVATILRIDSKTDHICKNIRFTSSVIYFSHMMFFFLWAVYTKHLISENRFGIIPFLFSTLMSVFLSCFVLSNKRVQNSKIVKILF